MTPSAPSHTTPLPCGLGVPLSEVRRALERWLRTEQPCWLVPESTDALPLHHLPADAPAQAVVVATSGSSGAAKRTVLSRDAVLAAVNATHTHLGGPGAWLLTLPPHYVAGLMVVLRSVVGHTPVVPCPGPLREEGLRVALEQLPPGRRYISVVPAQLSELLTQPAALHLLRRFYAVLVGGGPTPPPLRSALVHAGVPVVSTYGSSETAGGCVYNGVPLPGTRVMLREDQRILLAGPSLAHGYLRPCDTGLLWDAPLTQAAWGTHQGTRVHLTPDVGALDPSGVLSVLGRADDVLISGGVKVWPSQVEAALLTAFPEVHAIVVGTPHPRWGDCVTAVMHAPAPTLAELRERLRDRLPLAALPHAVVPVEHWPVLASGKPDRVRLRKLAEEASASATAAADSRDDVAE